jgi:hypothetical protein
MPGTQPKRESLVAGANKLPAGPANRTIHALFSLLPQE